MALSERERYGDRLEAELSRYGFVAIAPPGCWEHIAAAVVAAYQADLRGEIEAMAVRRTSREAWDIHQRAVYAAALDDVIALLEGGDHGNG